VLFFARKAGGHCYALSLFVEKERQGDSRQDWADFKHNPSICGLCVIAAAANRHPDLFHFHYLYSYLIF
jgi:hypothetical protein